MQNSLKPETPVSPGFDPSRPASFLSVLLGVITHPRSFFLGLETAPSVREPAIFAVVVGAIAAVVAVITRYALTPVFQTLFGPGTGDEVYGFGAIEAVGFTVVFPVFVALAAAVYLTAIKVFVGKVGNFTQLFTITAYAMSAMVVAWLPFIGAFAITYSLLVAMVVAIRYTFSTTLVTAIVISLTGFLPLALILIALRGIAFQVFGS